MQTGLSCCRGLSVTCQLVLHLYPHLLGYKWPPAMSNGPNVKLVTWAVALQTDSLRKFYVSLQEQRPDSIMAKKWYVCTSSILDSM